MNLPRHSAMPEFLSPRRDTDITTGAWSVQPGSFSRGDAWTAIDKRRMRVPFGNDEGARVVRAHEMMHARVSPADIDYAFDALNKFQPRVLECAEEFRINTLIKRAGFDTNALADGSESKAGKRVAESDAWNEAVAFTAACAGTKAATDFLRGVRSVNADWAKALREFEKALLKAATKIGKGLGSTEPDKTFPLAPAGFMQHTAKFAEMITAAIAIGEKTVTHEDGEDINDITETVTPERMKSIMKTEAGEGGAFAKLILKDVPLPKRVSGTMGRRRIATDSGRNPRRIHRMLTDPDRRVFDRVTKGQGGIVLVDQSGSMSFSTSDLWEIINAAPGCLVIGYSHASGSKTAPNAWIIADRGKVCEEVPEGNGGNGVDGPALRFALSKRKHNEPVIWVCDGMVTDGAQDWQYEHLSEECASLVVKHNVHMVFGLTEAKDALTRAKRGERLTANCVGDLRRTKSWIAAQASAA